MKKIIPVIIVVLAVIVAGYLYKKYRIAPDVKFETLALTDLNGNPVKLQDYQGKKLFLNFFQTWCGPCIGEFPSLDVAATVFLHNNFVFIAISDEPVPLLIHVQQHFNPRYLIILHSVKPLKELGVFTYPTSYLLNTKSQVVFQKTGTEDWIKPDVIQSLRAKAE